MTNLLSVWEKCFINCGPCPDLWLSCRSLQGSQGLGTSWDGVTMGLKAGHAVVFPLTSIQGRVLPPGKKYLGNTKERGRAKIHSRSPLFPWKKILFLMKHYLRVALLSGSRGKSHYFRKEMKWHFLAANFEFYILNHSKSFCSWRKIETYLKRGLRNSSKNYNSLG